MDTLDKESLSYKIPTFGQHVVIPLFCWDTWDLQLIPLGSDLPSPEVQADYLRRGLRMAGVIGFIEGKFCVAWEDPAPPDNVVEFLARKYCEWLYQTLVTFAPTKMQGDAAVAWLKTLMALPDPRGAN
jgi:hypothetical protein